MGINILKSNLMVDLRRWVMYRFDLVNNTIVVLDNLSKKEKTYYVPKSTNAIVIDNAIYVLTLDNKVMRVCLHNGSRKLVDNNDYNNINLNGLNQKSAAFLLL